MAGAEGRPLAHGDRREGAGVIEKSRVERERDIAREREKDRERERESER